MRKPTQHHDAQSNRAFIRGELNRPLFTIKEVAEILIVSSQTVRRLISKGKLTPIWVGGQRRIHPAVLEVYLLEASKRQRRGGG